MKITRCQLRKIIREQGATIEIPETEAQVSDILDGMGSDAAPAVADYIETNPDLLKDLIDANPATIEDFLKSSPDSASNLTGALDDSEVMSTLSNDPEAIRSMAQHYSDNPKDIPNDLVTQISKAIEAGQDTPKGDIQTQIETRYYNQPILRITEFKLRKLICDILKEARRR